ncbi:MAG: GAF domain-containing protein [Chroococcales cyanobacterium]
MYPQRQQALFRKIVDRIRNSLELPVVLQTAVDEVAGLLKLDYCGFLWYFDDTQRIQVVCEASHGQNPVSLLGYHPLEKLGVAAPAIAEGKLIINGSSVTIKPGFLARMSRLLSQFKQGIFHESQPILGFSSSLLIPIATKKDVIGFLACFSQQPRCWLTGEMTFLQSLTHSLEIAIAQAKLYEQTQKQATREKLVNQITLQTRHSLDLETILTEAIAQLLSALEVDRCLIHLVEDAQHAETLNAKKNGFARQTKAFRRKHLYEVFRPPFPPSLEDFDTNGPITQWVIENQKPVIISDITQDSRIGKNNEEYQKAQIKSSLVFPIKANGKLYALVYLNQCSHVRYWSENDQHLAKAVADQLAIAIQQGHLYAQMREQALQSQNQARQLKETLKELRMTQSQLIQSEKLLSLGQMVAGVAHELNNPVSFIYGNIPYLEIYVRDLLNLVETYRSEFPQGNPVIDEITEEIELDFVIKDLPQILTSMKSGSKRIHEIVQVLQDFSRHNQAPRKSIDIQAGLESTLLILQNQLRRHHIRIERHYSQLPLVECYPKSLNQVFLSLLNNAIESLQRTPVEEKIISLRTEVMPTPPGETPQIRIAIADNGMGIAPEIQSRIFDPFFTTKDIGKGRGLGLTASYQTIVEQHHGQLTVKSQLSKGAEFEIEIPITQTHSLNSKQTSFSTPVALKVG